jgi:hypothetical protein
MSYNPHAREPNTVSRRKRENMAMVAALAAKRRAEKEALVARLTAELIAREDVLAQKDRLPKKPGSENSEDKVPQ